MEKTLASRLENLTPFKPLSVGEDLGEAERKLATIAEATAKLSPKNKHIRRGLELRSWRKAF